MNAPPSLSRASRRGMHEAQTPDCIAVLFPLVAQEVGQIRADAAYAPRLPCRMASERTETEEVMSFDEPPDGDLHGECAAEIHRLAAELAEAKKVIAAADRLYSDTMYKWAPEAKDYYLEVRNSYEGIVVDGEAEQEKGDM